MMKRLLSLLLVLLLLPVLALAEASYHFTPAAIPLTDVQSKLCELGYLAPERLGKANQDETEQALAQFATDAFGDPSLADASEGFPNARVLVRLMATDVEVTRAVWVPLYGGKRYHKMQTACGMDDPECVDLSTAVYLGYTPCKRCYK